MIMLLVVVHGYLEILNLSTILSIGTLESPSYVIPSSIKSSRGKIRYVRKLKSDCGSQLY